MSLTQSGGLLLLCRRPAPHPSCTDNSRSNPSLLLLQNFSLLELCPPQKGMSVIESQLSLSSLFPSTTAHCLLYNHLAIRTKKISSTNTQRIYHRGWPGFLWARGKYEISQCPSPVNLSWWRQLYLEPVTYAPLCSLPDHRHTQAHHPARRSMEVLEEGMGTRSGDFLGDLPLDCTGILF